MKHFLFLILSLAIIPLKGQTSYIVFDSVSVISKTTDFSTLHDYIHISNLESSAFSMSWEYTLTGTKNSCPAAWDITLNDPDSTYFSISEGDSSGFILSATDTIMNKLIIGIDHNNTVGSCFIGFSIYPINDTLNKTNIGFDVTVAEGSNSTAIKEKEFKSPFLVYPVPSYTNFTVQSNYELIEKIVIYDIKNQVIQKIDCNNNEVMVNIEIPGTYFISIKGNKNDYIQKVVVSK